MTVNVAILGAGGTIARAIVRDLAESAEVAELVLLDLDAERAKAVAVEHGAGKARATGIDALGDRLVAVLHDCDVLLNAASYRVNLHAMQAALHARCDYLDLGGLYWMTGRQLELHDRFVAAGRLALLGMGASPGKTNVMAARAVRELGDEDVLELHVAAAGRDPEPATGLRTPYALRTLIDELTLAPVVLSDGAPVELQPMAPGGRVAFPPPVGDADTIHTLHSELRTFGPSFGVQKASFRLSLASSLLEALEQLVGASEEEVAAAAANAAPPSPRAISAHVVEARSATRRVTVSALTRPMDEWKLGGGIVSTAAPAAAAVRLMARGEIAARGVHPPEACIDPDALFDELERRGCSFTVTHAAPSERSAA
jgi:saccharopine dehydrogenase-like NADP-dependent oxidoreductase